MRSVHQVRLTLTIFASQDHFLAQIDPKKLSVVSPTAATFYFCQSFWSVLGSQALETPQLDFRELNEPHLHWFLQPSPEPVEPDLALHHRFLEPSPEYSAEPCWTWPGSAPKPPKPPPKPSPEPCWTWTGSAPKSPGTLSGYLSGTFSGTLLNLTWLCTKASHTFSGTFSGGSGAEPG